jgi:phosphatidylserine/phosphatidylglycerophosphate/cardiolipin synthase-like enzyme
VSRAWLGLVCAASLSAAFAFTSACNGAELTSGSSSGSTSGALPPDEVPSGEVDGAAPSGPRNPGADLDGGALPMTQAVTVQVQPSDNAAALLATMKSAKKSLHMTMYLLTDAAAIKVLTDLKTVSKIDVKVILNQTFPANDGSNQAAFTALKNKGVDVVWAPPGYTYTHAKAIGIDGEKLIVMTMNLTESSASTNREYIATDTDPQDVADYETIFQGDFTNSSTSLNGKLVLSPQSASNPDARQRLVALIDMAKQSLDVEVQSISDAAVVEAILAAHKAGVATRLIIDGNFAPSPSQADAIAKLKAAGVPIRSLKNPDIHAKTIVVDKKYAFVGSQNFTSNALFNNREVGLVIDSATESAKITASIEKDFAAGVAP